LFNRFGIKIVSGILIASLGLTLLPCGVSASVVSSENLLAGVAAEVPDFSEGQHMTNLPTPIAAAGKLTSTALALAKGEIVEKATLPEVTQPEESTTASEEGMTASEESTTAAEETSAAEDGNGEAEEQPKKKAANLHAIYKTIAISRVSSFVNIRKEASADSEAVGKLYNNSAAKILEKKDCDDGEWYKISSGSVKGYVKACYFVTGSEAEELAMELGRVTARVKAVSLRLREKADLSSETITVLSQGEVYSVDKVGDEFTRVLVDDDLAGYVHNDYIDLDIDFDEAISLEEEREQQEEEERKQRAAREAEEKLRKAQEEKERKKKEAETSTKAKSTTEAAEKKKTTEDDGRSTESSVKETERRTTAEAGSGSGDTSSELRDAIVAYAVSFVGKLDYVWGGTSLETGADCSGFVQQVFKKFGISLPRGSEMQAECGKGISSGQMRPGDIVYYGGHISIYIGDGQVVHASSPNSTPNTKISVWNYRSVECIRNVIGD